MKQQGMATMGFRPVPPISWIEHWLEGLTYDGNKISTTASRGNWLATMVGAGACTLDNQAGGVLKMLNAAADNDTINLQLNNEFVKLDRDVLFAARIKVTDVSETDWFVGLSVADTEVLGGSTDSIGFRCPDSTGDIDVLTELNSTETVADCGEDLADDTWVHLAFFFSASEQKVHFYVDGSEVGTSTTNLPTDEELAPVLQVRNDGGVAQSMYCDFVMVEFETQ